MSVRIQLRRDTAANWASTNPTLTQGEPGYETDTGKIKYGDGSTAWNSLAYAPSAAIVDGTIVNADVNASAAIDGTKISPDFGSQNVTTTGTATAAALIPSGSSVPTNGVYLPSANNVAISTNGTGRLFVDANGSIGAGTTSTSGYNLRLSKNLTGGAGFARGASLISTVQSDVTGNAWSFQSEVGVQDASFTLPELVHFYARQGIKGASATLTAQYGFIAASSITGAANNYGFYSNIATGTGRWNFYSAGTADSYFASNNFIFANGGTERARIDSSGRLGLGTSSPNALLSVNGDITATSSGTPLSVTNSTAPSSATDFSALTVFQLARAGIVGTTESAIARQVLYRYGNVSTNAKTGLGIELRESDSVYNRVISFQADGKVGIGTTSPAATLHVVSADNATTSLLSGATNAIRAVGNNTGIGGGAIEGVNAAASAFAPLFVGGSDLRFGISGTERARIDSSGRLLVGTSSAPSGPDGITPKIASASASGATAASDLQIAAYQAAGGTGRVKVSGKLFLGHSRSGTSGTLGGAVVDGDNLGEVRFWGDDGTNAITAAEIVAQVDGTPGTNDMPGRLVFSTTADGASSPTERMRIQARGDVLINTTTQDVAFVNGTGASFNNIGVLELSQSGTAFKVNRKTTDGTIVDFSQDGTLEGTISVSGTTVSYNGAHLSRWSQLPGGAERNEILRGTVLSNIDEMCGWGDEDNEQLNRMKVSHIEGDPNVSGVFQGWDDDDDTYTDDFYCAMTGDFIIRIAEAVTVQRGDLLMSAGDGTAKPQDDDIIRSRTIAKVTSTHVTCTYDDGSYCVPCVLMAC